MSKAPIPKNKVRKITKDLSCELTSDELKDRARDLAEAVKSVIRSENAKKSALQSYNAEIQMAEAKRDRLSNVVGSGAEYREVIVERIHDYKKNVVLEVRTDTGETISSREMTDKEKQLEIFDEEEDL